MLHTELSRPLLKVAKWIIHKVKGFPQSFNSCFLSLRDSNHTVLHYTILAALMGQEQKEHYVPLQFYVCPTSAFFLSLLLSYQFKHTFTNKSEVSVLTCVSYPQWNSSEPGGVQNVKQMAYSYLHAPGSPCWPPSAEHLQLLHLHQVPRPRLVLQQVAHLLASHL